MLRFDSEATVFVKVFGLFGERPECYAESESSGGISPYSGDNNNSGGDDEVSPRVRLERVEVD